MKRTNTVIIGGGQAGLAMSHSLARRGIDHLILERGRVAERWRSERWDSLRLLTPNWMSRLPGWSYQGPDPDGYMTMPEVIDYLEGYARSFSAPVQDQTQVLEVRPRDGGYRIRTDQRTYLARNVVVATGYCGRPFVPPLARQLSSRIFQIHPSDYRNPEQLPPGGVLVVGASATGIQLAEEIHESGRPVTLACGRHTRMPRVYRGKDILYWLDRMGMLDQRAEDVYDLEISRKQPSLQLVGRPDRRTLDLPRLEQTGVRLTGRLLAAQGERVHFEDDLIAYTASADVKLAALLRRVDQFIRDSSLEPLVGPPEEFQPFLWPEAAPTFMNLKDQGIESVLWATGFERNYPWLDVPVLDERGEIRHRGGVTPAPGLYLIGMQFLRRRNSAFIDGVGADAEELANHLRRYNERRNAA